MMDAPLKKPELRVEPLARDTLHEQAYRRICDLILDGEIAIAEDEVVRLHVQLFLVFLCPTLGHAIPVPVRNPLRPQNRGRSGHARRARR